MSGEKKSKKQEDWIQHKWRPMMAVMYMAVCIFDFVLFPIMFTIVQFWETEAVNDAFRQWQPITLLGGGLFHVAMGAVLGVTAWSRGQEKIAGVAVNSGGSAMGANTSLGMPTGFGQPTYGGYSTNQPYQSNSTYSGFEQTRETFTATPVTTTGYKGKKAPIPPEDPVI